MQTRTALSAVLALTLFSGFTTAGPLVPPAGPITSTMKTLEQVEPRIPLSSDKTPGDSGYIFRINQQGSYYLTSSLFPAGSSGGIVISASDVTLDLCGYTVNSATTNGAIVINGNRVVVKNGLANATNSTARTVLVNAGSDQIVLDHLQVTASSASLAACIAVSNAADTGHVLVTDCKLSGSNAGVWCFGNDQPITIRNTEISNYYGFGINAGERAVIENCIISDYASGVGSTASAIRVGAGSVVRNCVITEPSTSNVGTDKAINITGNSVTVEGCRLECRGTAGIYAFVNNCTIRNNSIVMANSGANAIYSSGSGTFIADNHIRMNTGTAIATNTSTGCTIIRNCISGATTGVGGSSLASNIVGPVAGNGNPTASTNPHANFVN